MAGDTLAKKCTEYLIEASGILRQQQANGPSLGLNTLTTSKNWLRLLNTSDNWFPGYIQRLCGRDGSQGVIDIIKSRQGDNQLSCLRARTHLNAPAIEAIQLDLCGAYIRLWSLGLAVRARIMAHMT